MSGSAFNRHAQKSSTQGDFDFSSLPLPELSEYASHLDLEGLSRRHKIAKGTLVVLDFIPLPQYADLTYEDRREILLSVLDVHPLSVEGWTKPSYLVFSTYGYDMSEQDLWDVVSDRSVNPYDKFCNAVFEGMVSKQAGSRYLTMRHDKAETHLWQKHRLQ
jgi:hypothetical protein